MRKLILKMELSVDGFIEAPGGDMSWFPQDDADQWEQLFVILEDVDLFLLGRNMFADYKNYWVKALNNPKASANERAYAELADQTKHIVFSRTLKQPGWHNTEIVSGNVIDEVRLLKELPGKSIQIVGGATLAGSLIEADLVDEYHLVVHPVMLAGGKSFFNNLTKRRPLQFIDAKTTSTSATLHYKAVR